MTLGSTSEQLVLSMRSYWNPQGPTQRTLLNYSSADALTAQGANATNVNVPINTVGFKIDFSQLFPALVLPLFVYVTEVTEPAGIGFLYYFTTGASSGAKQAVGPDGFFSWIGNGTTAPNPIYIDNPSLTTVLDLEVGIASN